MNGYDGGCRTLPTSTKAPNTWNFQEPVAPDPGGVPVALDPGYAMPNGVTGPVEQTTRMTNESTNTR